MCVSCFGLSPLAVQSAMAQRHKPVSITPGNFAKCRRCSFWIESTNTRHACPEDPSQRVIKRNRGWGIAKRPGRQEKHDFLEAQSRGEREITVLGKGDSVVDRRKAKRFEVGIDWSEYFTVKPTRQHLQDVSLLAQKKEDEAKKTQALLKDSAILLNEQDTMLRLAASELRLAKSERDEAKKLVQCKIMQNLYGEFMRNRYVAL